MIKYVRTISISTRKRCGGNTIIEIVFTLLPTFALVFAFIDFGLMVFRWSTLQNAVREGCRYAITFQRDGGNGQDASIRKVVDRYAFGIVKASDNPQKITVSYFSPTNLTTPITSGGNLPGNIVEVAVKNISWAELAPLSGGFGGGIPMLRTGSPIAINVYALDMLGGYPAGVTSVAR